MIKNLRKKVIFKDEEVCEPRKSSNREDENIEPRQSINFEESKASKSEVKEDEPVEDVLPTESDQDVEEQHERPITVLSEEDEKYLSDEARFPANNEARVCSKQEIHTHFEEETVS